MDEEIKHLRQLSEVGANGAMLASLEIVIEAKAGNCPSGILVRYLRKELAREPEGANRDAILEGFCDQLQRFIEAWGSDAPTIPTELR